MLFRLVKPRPELRHLVSRIMINRFRLDPTQPKPVNPFPPQPEHTLYFYPYNTTVCKNYADGSINNMPHSIIVGPQLSRVDLTLGYDMLIVMVGFQPGGLHRLLRVPMHEIQNIAIDSTMVLGKEIENVTEQLNRANDTNEMVQVIETYLLKKLKGVRASLPVEQVLSQLVIQKNMINVDQLAKASCISSRQLERQFKERIGMSPKLYARLVRFSKAWVMREKNPRISWLEIAHSCDYADQMHMIRDFKDFVGVTPGILQSSLEQTSLRLQAETFD